MIEIQDDWISGFNSARLSTLGREIRLSPVEGKILEFRGKVLSQSKISSGLHFYV